jgi:hypothetical protein
VPHFSSTTREPEDKVKSCGERTPAHLNESLAQDAVRDGLFLAVLLLQLAVLGSQSAYGAKKPLMSMIRSVLSVTNTLIAPSVPAGTRAAFATTVPV